MLRGSTWRLGCSGLGALGLKLSSVDPMPVPFFSNVFADLVPTAYLGSLHKIFPPQLNARIFQETLGTTGVSS